MQGVLVVRAPDSFYDDETELSREDYDLKLAKLSGGLQHLTKVSDSGSPLP